MQYMIRSAGVCCLAVCMVMVSAVSSRANSEYDCLFNWLETSFPSYLSPAGGSSETVLTYYYRYYSQTGSYVAVDTSDASLWYLGPGSAGMINIGPVSAWLSQSGCGSGSGSNSDIQILVDKVLGLSNNIEKDMSQQLMPILTALGGTGSTCPTVATNLDPSTMTDLADFISNLPNPANISLDYGSGCTTQTGDQMSGQMGMVVSDFTLDPAIYNLSLNFQLNVNNLMTNGQLVSNGQMSGSVDMALAGSGSGTGSIQFTNFLIDGDTALTGSLDILAQSNSDVVLKMNFSATQGLQVNLDMLIRKTTDDIYQISTPAAGTVNQYTVMVNDVVFNETICKDYPVAGSIVFSQGGQDWTIPFDDSCSGDIKVLP